MLNRIESRIMEQHGDMSDVNKELKRQELLIKHQPDRNARDDKRITALIREQLASTDWSRNVFPQLHKSSVDYYRESMQDLGTNREDIHTRTQELLSQIASIGNSKIVEGREHLSRLPQSSRVFLVSNHLGAYKLVDIYPEKDLGIKIEARDNKLESMHVLPLFYGALKPVADELGDNLYIAAYNFPDPIGEIQRAADGVIVPLEEEQKELGDSGGVDYLSNATKELFERRKRVALTGFPEGGTSGKRNMGGPYDLAEFKRGVFVIAAKVGAPILPVAQYFNPESGFELAIFEPISLAEDAPREEFEKAAVDTRDKMQAWLDQRKQAA